MENMAGRRAVRFVVCCRNYALMTWNKESETSALVLISRIVTLEKSVCIMNSLSRVSIKIEVYERLILDVSFSLFKLDPEIGLNYC